MALSVVQNSAVATASGNPSAAAASISPSSGNALIAFLLQDDGDIRTYTITDNIDGATGWSQAKYYNPGQAAGIWYKVNIPPGITGVTSTVNTGVESHNLIILEVSGFGTAITVDASDQLLDGVGTDSHKCSNAGISSGNEVLAVCCGVLGANGSECNPGSGYTEIPGSHTSPFFLRQHRIFSSGCTNETGAWTASDTRVATSVMALLSGNAVGGGGKVRRRQRMLLGVG